MSEADARTLEAAIAQAALEHAVTAARDLLPIRSQLTDHDLAVLTRISGELQGVMADLGLV